MGEGKSHKRNSVCVLTLHNTYITEELSKSQFRTPKRSDGTTTTAAAPATDISPLNVKERNLVQRQRSNY